MMMPEFVRLPVAEIVVVPALLSIPNPTVFWTITCPLAAVRVPEVLRKPVLRLPVLKIISLPLTVTVPSFLMPVLLVPVLVMFRVPLTVIVLLL